VILAGMINALNRTGTPIREQRAVFMGAGSAGVGVAKQIVEYFIKEGLTEDEARRCFWLVDTKVSKINSLDFENSTEETRA
jgi:malate dehydrogenase (oxaloacetate-decarboxylating)(NADP+)